MQVGQAQIAILSLQVYMYIWLLPAVNAATDRCCQHGRWWTTATVPQVECDTSLVVNSGVDCGRRW